MFSDQKAERRVTVDLAPLIDIVFLLLIFFLVTTTFLPDAGMDLELPESTTAAPSQLTQTVVSVSEDGAIQLGGRAVSVDELQRAVEALSEADRQKITVRADARVGYGVIVRIIDALRNAGVDGVSLPMDAVQGGGGRNR